VGHRSTLEDYPKIGAANRKGSLKGGPGFVKQLREMVAEGKNFLGEKITDEERAGYTSDANLVESYLADAPSFKAIMPTVLVDDRLELDLAGRKVEILFLGRAHTGGDLVVRLPKENIVVTGDLIVYPVPLVGSTSYPLEYGATLEKLLALKAKTMIPGHGPVTRDDAYLRLMIRLMNSIKQQVEAAVAKGLTLEGTRKNIDLSEFVKAFAGDSSHKKFIFYNYVTEPAVTAAYYQAKKNS
jgi:cyclase